jgi:hypothetical protein
MPESDPIRLFTRSVPAFVALIFAAALSGENAAAIGVYEPFDYPVGELIEGLGNGSESDIGFGTKTWGTTADDENGDTIGSGSLSCGALQTSGNHLRMISANPVTPTSNDVRRTDEFDNNAIVEGQVVWASWLIRLDEGDVQTDYSQIMISPESGSISPLFVGIEPGDSERRFGLHKYDNVFGNVFSYSDVSLVLDQTFFLVIKIVFHETVDILPSTEDIFEEEVSLFVNPTLGGSDPITADATLNEIDISRSGINRGVSRIYEIGAYASGAGSVWLFDEFRIGSSYSADIAPIPELSTMILALLGGSVILLRRRR